ncbi:hypothetical protein BGX21_007892 [Mortierella sp. AD011]|nr:hypothetical protein BGX20_009617 [Mortierella sp. AD010]KAF9398355.1 hypothetical protein BGX21_007892 [Mortierella sp. AD011]
MVYLCRYDTLDRYSFLCPHLETLEVHDRTWSSIFTNPLWLNVADLIAESPTLTTIKLSANHNALAMDIWDVILDSPKVKTLQLDSVRITEVEQASAFFRVCAVLERLELEMCDILDFWRSENEESLAVPAFFPFLHEIKIVKPFQNNSEAQLQMVTKCPALRSLCWCGARISLLFLLLADETIFACPKFESLDVKRGWLWRPDIELFLKTTRNPLKRLLIPASGLDQAMLKYLEPHFQSLQDLDISLCEDVTSGGIVLLLRSCPFLTSFKAGVLLAADITPGETWACADRLVTLSLMIGVRDTMTATDSETAFNCLSKLRFLEELRLLGHGETTPEFSLPKSRTYSQNIILLQLRLDCGLARLSTLWYLKRLYFSEAEGQNMTMEEGNWIKDHWKMLQMVQGRFNNDAKLNSEIHELFKKCNSRYTRRLLRDKPLS